MASIGSVSVDVVPDASGFAEKLKAKLRDIEVKVGVDLDDSKAKAALDKLGASSKTVKVSADLDASKAKASLDALTKNRSVTIKADADTGTSGAKLDTLARNRTANVQVKVEQSGFARAQAYLSDMGKELFSLQGAIVSLGPALIPATAALAGLAGALGAPALSAGAGAGIFAGLSMAAMTKALKDAKEIEKLRTSANTATDPAKAADFTRQANEMMAALPKAERAFLKAKDSIGKGFGNLLKTSGGALFGPLTEGSRLLGRTLPKLSPVVDAFGASITGMLRSLSRFVDSNGFAEFTGFLSTVGVGAFGQLVSILTNVTKGVGGMVKAFSPLGTTVLGSIDKATGAFARFGKAAGSGQSAGFQRFLDYVSEVGPKTARTLGHIAGAVGHVVLALAPQGSTILGVLDGLATAVSKMSPAKIAAIAGAVGALGLATGKFGKLTSLTLLVSAISYANSHSKAFHSLADGALKFADAINSLPTSIKIGLGGAAAIGLAASRLRSGSGGVVGQVASKVFGGGVQKVFVTNPGFGSNLPGKGGTTAAGGKAGIGGKIATGVAAAGGGIAVGALAGLAATLAAAAFGAAKLGKVAESRMPGTAKFGSANRPTETQLFTPGFNKNADGSIAKVQQYRANVDLATKANKNFRGALGQVVSGTARSGAVFSKTGLTVREVARGFRSLPKSVQTKLSTPGAVKSKADVQGLVKQFKLTPKQKSTLYKITGIAKAQRDGASVKKTIQQLRKDAKPSVILQDRATAKGKALRGFLQQKVGKTVAKPLATLTDRATPAGRRVQGFLRILGRQHPTPTVSLRDQASGRISGIQAAINGLHGKDVAVRVNYMMVGNKRAALDARASGGPVSANTPYLVGENGPELVVPKASGMVVNANGTKRLMNNKVAGVAGGGGGGANVFHLYDSSGALMGTMRGVAATEVKGRNALAGTTGRMGRS